MNKVDQRRFDNQPSDYLTAREAARRLGVELRTLYAYASRGLVRSVPSGRGRKRLYPRDEIERLRARSAARSGHGPVAAAALDWGEPVLESAITAIGRDGPLYRGYGATELASQGVGFEAVAELLWNGELPLGPPRWPSECAAGELAAARNAPPIARLALAAGWFGVRGEATWLASPEIEQERARLLVRRLVAALASDRRRQRAALRAPSLAALSLAVLGGRPSAEAIAAVDATLVVCADHELNASTFAARVAASTGADLYACITAALATLSGPLHGGASDRVEALLDEVRTPNRARRVLSERARRGDAVPGFGHPLYPSGDPRGTLLLESARRLKAESARLDTLLAVVRAMRRAGAPEPNLDVGLVAVRAALGLAPGSAAALFAIGRCAGFIAHVLEQRSSGKLLRPRARYVGRAQRPMSSSRSSP